MAGHSKWANIKHRKARQDAKKGKTFTKIIRELTVAARAMGCDQVLEQATVEQAIDRALALAESDDAILITGSLYIVGGARPYLRKVL